MLERLITKGKRKALTLAIAITLPFLAACATKTTAPEEMKRMIDYIHEPAEMDYKSMTWQEAIKAISTPRQAAHYLQNHMHQIGQSKDDGTKYVDSDMETFEQNHKDQIGDCLDYTMAAAALLSDDGYEPTMMVLKNKTESHAVFIYKTKTNKYSTIGASYIPPQYTNLDDLALAQNALTDTGYTHYAIINLDDVDGIRWMNGEGVAMNYYWPDKFTPIPEPKIIKDYDDSVFDKAYDAAEDAIRYFNNADPKEIQELLTK